MAKEKAKPFMLVDLPAYEYPLNICCPECYRPLDSRNRKDGRCDICRKSKQVLPINYFRIQRKKTDEDEEDDRRSRRYRDDD